MTVLLRLSLALMATVVLVGCGSISDQFINLMMAPESTARFPDVVDVELRRTGDRLYDVVVTLSSPYDTPQRYADGWRVLDEDGNVLGIHTLLHDHAAEQPFTRTQPGLHIAEGISEVMVEGRDQVHGFGGQTMTVAVPE